MTPMARPYLPPSLGALLAGEDGSAARLREEERLRAAAFEAGRRRGHEEGLAQGRGEGAAQAEAAAAARLEDELSRRAAQGAQLAAQALERLLAERAEERRVMDGEARAAVVAALEAVFPQLLARAAGAEVAAMLAEAVSMRGEDVILLTAHPETLAALQRDGFPPTGDAPSRLRLLPEPAMPPGSAEASWVSGGLVYRPDVLAAQAIAILEAPRAPAEPSQEIKP
ncbi:hypothetical protein [Roseomonas marmotae]|uniref:Flagellar assembly protein FliH/Type III secretion system HrpE domain-containing protein n=1 Tax=Roseomonas marmotae TaxID=2768161 RepID=A0ABS3KIB3_9PROT|nr:hypothetical protein [Roseomonas marmotae]MBO1076056.1 hypothetical protein [Roseomonas marmotae]QTI81295.1 hypothetical protein IAI58_18230 [Roseomonas marmotae]